MIATSSSRSKEHRSVVTRGVFTTLFVVACALAVGVLASANLLLALVAVLLAVVVIAVVRVPDVAVFATVFILYSNLAVVATRFHGVPAIVASTFPLLLVFPLARDLVLRGKGLVITPAMPFLGLLLVIQVIGMLFSRNPVVAWRAVLELITEGILIYLLIVNAVRTPKALRLAVWALLFAGFVSAVAPLYQQLTGSFESNFGGFGQTSEVGFRTGELTRHGEARQLRLAGPIGEQNRYAQNMLMVIPLGLLQSVAGRSKKERYLALFLTIFTGIGFLLAFSRGGAVAFAVVFALMVLMRTFSSRFILHVGLAVLLVLIAMPQYLKRLTTLADVSAAVSTGGTGDIDSAIKGRLTEMIAAALVFADHPVVGVGPGMFKHYSREYGNRLGIRKLEGNREAHSLYLEVAAESGILGLISFFGMVGVTLYGLVLARRRLLHAPADDRRAIGTGNDHRDLANMTTGFLLAMIAYLASAAFLHLSYIRFFYLMLALAGAAAVVAGNHPVRKHEDVRL